MTDEEAIVVAQAHVAEERLEDPNYRVGFSQPQAISEGWYFDYMFEPINPIPESEWESFCGAPGFIVPKSGAIPRVVSWAEYHELRLGEALR